MEAETKFKELWEIETQFWIVERDLPPEVAHWLTIVRWMHNGNLRPLAAVIREGNVDPAVLYSLAEMIEEDRIRVVARKRGSPKKPEREARDLLIAKAYGNRSGKSADRIEDLAKAIGMSEETVRKAITQSRKLKRA